MPVKAAGPTLLCRVYNGETYIDSFLQHYRQLGIGHMVFLDNGSTDRSVALLSGHSDVTLYQTTLPFKTHRLWMRRFLMNQCAQGSWTLSVDIDELFDYPLSHSCNLAQLVGYLERYRYTAMRAHMLGFFADLPIVRNTDPSGSLKERFPWYDLSGMQPLDHGLFDTELPAWRGGLRSAAFGSDHFWLTKHPLLKTGCGVEAFLENEHSVAHAVLADVTGVLQHYKFTADFPRVVAEAVASGHHWNDSTEYRLYDNLIKNQPGFSFKSDTSRLWHSADTLLEEEFLTASPRFLAWASLRDLL